MSDADATDTPVLDTVTLMMRAMGAAVEDQLELLLAERAIARVLHSYSRGADRCDLELMRSCYWPDGTDDHGSYNGGVDGFIEFVGPALQRFERTNHFLGNMPTVSAFRMAA